MNNDSYKPGWTLEDIIGKDEKEPEIPKRKIIQKNCLNCGGNYAPKSDDMGYCSKDCYWSHAPEADSDIDDDLDDLDDAIPISFASYGAKQGGMRGGATEITDNTLEKKLIDVTAPYNEKAAKNAKNFAKASIEVGKAILDQLDLNPLAFIEKAKELGVKIYKITQEGIYLLFPGDANIGKSVDKLIKSGTKLYFIPVRILGTIAITIFLSMFGVSIDLKFLEKIHGLKQFIDLIIKYTSIITKILKNFDIPGLSIPTLSLKNLLFPNVIDAAYRKGDYEGGSKKKKTRRKTRRKTKRKKN